MINFKIETILTNDPIESTIKAVNQVHYYKLSQLEKILLSSISTDEDDTIIV